jgi:hypothetical protein
MEFEAEAKGDEKKSFFRIHVTPDDKPRRLGVACRPRARARLRDVKFLLTPESHAA